MLDSILRAAASEGVTVQVSIGEGADVYMNAIGRLEAPKTSSKHFHLVVTRGRATRIGARFSSKMVRAVHATNNGDNGHAHFNIVLDPAQLQ